MRKTVTYKAGNLDLPLEFFFPKNFGKGEKHPCIIFYYGGGFTKRNLDNFYGYSEFFSNKGFVCVCADYRLNSEVNDLKECYQDAIEAFREVYDHAEDYEIDKERIAVCGHSSGGSLACWVGLHTQLPKINILLAPGVAWQYRNVEYVEDNHSGYEEIIKAESTRHADWEQSYYLLDKYPLKTTLIVVGTADEVCYRGCALFHQKALDLGYNSHLLLYQNQPHGFVNYGRTENNFGFYNVLEKVEQFIDKNL